MGISSGTCLCRTNYLRIELITGTAALDEGTQDSDHRGSYEESGASCGLIALPHHRTALRQPSAINENSKALQTSKLKIMATIAVCFDAEKSMFHVGASSGLMDAGS